MNACRHTPDLFVADQGQATKPRENGLSRAERDALAMSCQGLCRSEAAKAAEVFRRPAHEREDLTQEALLAAVEAARRFDPATGAKFSTFAVVLIRRRLVTLLRVKFVPAYSLEGWDTVPGAGGDDGPADRPPPNAEQERLLGVLGEPARSLVRLTRFGGLSLGRAAEQLDLPAKDAALILRNAAATLAAAVDADELADSLYGGIDVADMDAADRRAA